MGFWKFFADLLTFQVPEQGQPFELLETSEDFKGNEKTKTDTAGDPQEGKKSTLSRAANFATQKPKPVSPDLETTNTLNKRSKGKRTRRPLKRPQKIGTQTGPSEVVKNVENLLRQKQKDRQTLDTGKANRPEPTNAKGESSPVFPDLKENLLYIGDAFCWPQNTDLVMREFMVGTKPPVKAVAVYLEGLADPNRIQQAILKPLMLLSELDDLEISTPLLPLIEQRLATDATLEIKNDLRESVKKISDGVTILFFQGVPEVLCVETSDWPHRGVEKAVSERVIRGPQDAYNEDLNTNVALLRSFLRNPRLVREDLTLGTRANNQCALIYLQDLVNPRLVDEAKTRVQSLEIDAVLSSGAFEQLIEDNSWGLFPLSMATERKDRTAAALLDGKIVLMLAGDPFVLVYPSTAWSLMQAAEDHALRPLAAAFLRAIRWISAVTLLFLPGLYVAVTGFHPEMIPTDLLISITANRSRVPFPSVIEILIMEFSFELIREAGIRIPGVIGPTLGIVGAIILGEAAVAAALVNPVVIVIVAIVGISSFAIPSFALSLALRIYRFVYILLGATLGLFGLGLGFAVQLILLSSLKSMGVPYLAPISPFTKTNRDVVFQGHHWKQRRRPDYLGAKDPYRQAPIARKWILNPHKKGGKK